jgi:hypothetical protein
MTPRSGRSGSPGWISTDRSRRRHRKRPRPSWRPRAQDRPRRGGSRLTEVSSRAGPSDRAASPLRRDRPRGQTEERRRSRAEHPNSSAVVGATGLVGRWPGSGPTRPSSTDRLQSKHGSARTRSVAGGGLTRAPCPAEGTARANYPADPPTGRRRGTSRGARGELELSPTRYPVR